MKAAESEMEIGLALEKTSAARVKGLKLSVDTSRLNHSDLPVRTDNVRRAALEALSYRSNTRKANFRRYLPLVYFGQECGSSPCEIYRINLVP